jgi:hypothetical protein
VVACTYAGAVLSQAGGATVYSFTVPRSVQAAGSEALLAVTVTALDVAGDQGQGAGVVQIDDAPPIVGALKLISTAGVAGEDGKTWFQGDANAPNVEVAVPVTDNGVGFGSLKLHLDQADLYGGFPTASLDVTGTPMADGVHFLLPASGVRGQEQHLRFTLTASDLLLHTVSIGPDDPRTMIWVDALPPVIAFAPRVDYTSASGTNPQCAAPDSSTYRCGRQSSSHLLADDTATVSFDVYDCGVGIISGQPDASVNTKAGGAHAASVSQIAKDGAPCSNGSTNKTHHYKFTLNLVSQAPVLDRPDPTGTTLVQLVANAVDGLGQTASRGAPGSATSGDGLALVSLWRWKNQAASTAAQPSGSPALIPGTVSQRQIAVGTTLPSTSPNLFVLNADGSLAWSAQVSPGVGADVAAGPSGKLYAVSPAAPSCTTTCSAALNIISAPSTGMLGSAQSCPANNVSFGGSPVIALAPERAVVASTNHAVAALSNVFVFQTSTCSSPETTLVGTGDYPGVSASWPTLLLATGQGFSSVDRNGTDTGFDTTTLTTYNNGTATVTTLSPPSVSNSPLNAFFGSTSDRKVRRAAKTCTGVNCWTDVGGFTPPTAGSGLPYTPVFDSATIYTADDVGKVYTFARSNGTAGWTADFRASPPSPWPSNSSATVSAPVLLQSGSVLVVRNDGVVALASSAGIVPLLDTKAPLSGAPVSPAIETRGTGGVAYVSDGAGWVWALQTPAAPLAASAAVWPRPGRDSCNSRNAASSCQ